MPTQPTSPFSHTHTHTHHQPDSSPPGLAQWACCTKASAYGSRVGWSPARRNNNNNRWGTGWPRFIWKTAVKLGSGCTLAVDAWAVTVGTARWGVACRIKCHSPIRGKCTYHHVAVYWSIVVGVCVPVTTVVWWPWVMLDCIPHGLVLYAHCPFVQCPGF